MKRSARVLAFLFALLASGWCAGALYVDAPLAPYAEHVAIGFVLVSLVLSQLERGPGVAIVAWLCVVLWWVTLRPSNERDWVPDQARIATIHRGALELRVEDVRDFRWTSRTEAEERWVERTWRLDRLAGIDVLISDWGSEHIAHTIVSWVWSDGAPPLSVSIEARRERGETYHPLRGLYRQYELAYVVADERDLVTLRTQHRGERMLLYRLDASPPLARRLLDAYLDEIARLPEHPEWYHSLLRNCSTTTRHHVAAIGVSGTWDWRVLFNGHLDELFYARGAVDTSMPFETLRARSEITERAIALSADDPEFSLHLREGLPERPRD